VVSRLLWERGIPSTVLARLGARLRDQSRQVRVCVQQLRRKVETDPERPHHLATETGIGYRLRGAGLGTPLFEGRTVGTAGALTPGACLDLPAVEEL